MIDTYLPHGKNMASVYRVEAFIYTENPCFRVNFKSFFFLTRKHGSVCRRYEINK